MSIQDNGPIDTWIVGTRKDPNDAKLFLNKYVAPYMNIAKQTQTYIEGHWDQSRVYLNNSDANYNNSAARFYLNDGSSITGMIENTGGTFNIYVDINGDKKPNKMGKDIFKYHYYINYQNENDLNGKFFPNGYGETRTSLKSSAISRCNKLYTGDACSALIMIDGWQIKDDYPW